MPDMIVNINRLLFRNSLQGFNIILVAGSCRSAVTGDKTARMDKKHRQ